VRRKPEINGKKVEKKTHDEMRGHVILISSVKIRRFSEGGKSIAS
jgi:hypothetical protein